MIGGTKRVAGVAEFRFPLPGAEQEKSLRMGVFLDGGQVYGASEKIDLGQMRYSSGVSLSWNSPFGPLRFSVAQPLNRKPGDYIQRLQFTMGTAF